MGISPGAQRLPQVVGNVIARTSTPGLETGVIRETHRRAGWGRDSSGAGAGTLPTASTHALALKLLDERAHLADAVLARILADDMHYEESTLVPHAYLRSSCETNIDGILRHLTGDALDTRVAFETGERKAGLGVPPEAMLHAYRLGGRTIWDRLVELADRHVGPELLDMSVRLWESIDVLSDIAASAYRSRSDADTRLDRETRRRMLDAILDGPAHDARRQWEAIRALGFPELGNFVVVTGQIHDPGHDELGGLRARLERLPDMVAAWRREPTRVTGLICCRPDADLDLTIRDALRALQTRAGISRVFGRAVDAPRGLTEADVAMHTATSELSGPTAYRQVPVEALLVREPAGAADLAQLVLGPVLDLPEDDRRVLIDTAFAWIECNGSTSRTAELLHYHRNTVRYRLRRLEQLSGRSFSDPRGTAELVVALHAARLTSEADGNPAADGSGP